MLAHEKCGLTILGLLVFRLIWGVIGYPTARFAQFVKGPRAMFAYLHQLIGREKVYSFGHNPIGALSVIALLSVILLQALSGTLSTDDIIYDSPLYNVFRCSQNLQEVCINFATLNSISYCTTSHAIVCHHIFFKEKLLSQMITGKAQEGNLLLENKTV